MYPKILILYAMMMGPQAALASVKVDCYLDASNRTNLTYEQKVRLCARAMNLEPVNCYLDASNRTNLVPEHKIALCERAQ